MPAEGSQRSSVAIAQPVDAQREDLSAFSCPNPDCKHFNVFGQGNLRVAERMGKDRRLRRLACRCCQTRFSELQGTLLEYGHLSKEKVVLMVKCLTWGNSVEATADIAEVDPRTVQRIVDRGGRRAERFHRQKVRELETPQVQMDEMRGGGGKKEGPCGGVAFHGPRGLFALLARCFGGGA